jgi:glycosyltransferase involved in cell wall biosynthesis
VADRIAVAQVITRFTAGAGGVALRGALALDRERFDVRVFAAPGGSLTPEAIEAGIPVVPIPSLRPELDPVHDRRALEELTGHLARTRFDVVHTHSAKAGAIGRWAGRRARVPTIVHTFHGFPFHPFQSPPRRRAYLAIERSLARITDHFFAVGSAVAAEAVRLRIAPPDRVEVVASAVDGARIVARDASTRAAARVRLGLPPEAPVVGCVGRLDRQKAPGDLVEAMALLDRPDVWCVWVGDGPLRSSVRELAERRGVSGRFVLTGDRDDVPELLPAFDVFALPSLYEGIPCALVEAMLCGIPVVGTTVNGVHEVVSPGRTGLLARPADPPSVAVAIRFQLDHPARAGRMADRARAGLADRFDPEVLGRQLEDVYVGVRPDASARDRILVPAPS